MKFFAPILLLFVSFKLTAQQKDKATIKNIDTYIEQVQNKYKIPGVALAVIKDNKIIHKNFYGLSNIELSVPVTDKTLFPLFSTSKIFSVIAVYQLIEEKKLSLDNFISDFITDLPETWKKVQVKNLITHSSGLPDIVKYSEDKEENAKQKVYADTIRFNPGKRFDYNQTNFWLVNRIIQKLTNKTLSEYVIDKQFPSSLDAVIYEGNNLKVVKNLTYGYITNPDNNQTLKRNWSFPGYLYGASALNLTLDSFINWNKEFDSGNFISDITQEQLFSTFQFEEKRDFSYGLDLIRIGDGFSYGFSGGVSTEYRKFPKKKLTIILLANGLFIPNDKQKGIDEVVNKIAEIIDAK